MRGIPSLRFFCNARRPFKDAPDQPRTKTPSLSVQQGSLPELPRYGSPVWELHPTYYQCYDGCINLQPGQLGDNGKTYRRWQHVACSRTAVLSTLATKKSRRSSPSSHRRKNSSRRYDNNSRNNNAHSNPGQSHHNASEHQHCNAGGAQGVGPTTNSLTVSQPQQGAPPAPTSGAQVPVIRYGSAPNTNLNGRQPGTFRTH